MSTPVKLRELYRGLGVTYADIQMTYFSRKAPCQTEKEVQTCHPLKIFGELLNKKIGGGLCS